MSDIPEPPSITKQPVFRPKMNKQICMEDLGECQLAFFDALEKRGIKFASDDEENKFWRSMGLFLEESFNWPDYASHN